MVNFSLWENEVLQSNESTDKMEMKQKAHNSNLILVYLILLSLQNVSSSTDVFKYASGSETLPLNYSGVLWW